jgi:small-conductance mechanosensitive channel
VEAVNRQQEQLAKHPDQSPQTAVAHNRPFRAIIISVLACAAAVGVNLYGVPFDITTTKEAQAAGIDLVIPINSARLITLAGSLTFLILGLSATFAWARWARSMLERLIGIAYSSIVRYVLILLGLCFVGVITLSMLGFRVGQLVLGGAVTGVLITIAAQQSLSNLFAGVMLQFAQPFKVGDWVRIRAGALGGTIEGMVAEVSITYVSLDTDEGRVLLPNGQVLAAAISPLRSAPNQGVLIQHRHGFFSRASPRPPMTSSPPPATDTAQTVVTHAEAQAAAQMTDNRQSPDSAPSEPGGQAGSAGQAPGSDARPDAKN